MVPRRDDPLPLEAVRDLPGVVRAIYAAELARGAGPPVLRRIERVGRLLADALDLAATTEPGTVGHRAAWRKAEDAVVSVGDFVDALTPAERIVGAAQGRVRRG